MIHTCSYHCHRPECVKAQRDELRDKLLSREWVGLTDEEYRFFVEEADSAIARRVEEILKEKNT